jgi:hypothetical protein
MTPQSHNIILHKSTVEVVHNRPAYRAFPVPMTPAADFSCMVDPRIIGERVPEISEHQLRTRLLNFGTHMHTTPLPREKRKADGDPGSWSMRETGEFLVHAVGPCSPSANNNEQDLSQIRSQRVQR